MKAIPLAMAAALIVASASVPFLPIPQDGADDGLFVRLAANILRYGWLGPYDEWTLAKGPFYPLFLAASFRSGLPFLAVQAALYAVSSLTLARAGGMLSRSRGVEFLGATLLLLNPVLFEMGSLRVLRDSIYVSLTMLVVALALFCHILQHLHPARRILLAGGTGIALAALWLTREEGVWILPPLLFIAALHVFRIRSQGYRAILREGAILAMIGGTAAACVGAVCLINEWQYGVGDVVEFKQAEYVAAYSALSRIRHANVQRRARLGWAALEQAYRVSPAAAELRTYLAGPIGANMVEAGCAGGDGRLISPCDGEIRDAWLIWALRDAAAAAGHYRNAREARRFWGRLAREVNAACSDGRLSCGPPRHSLLPPVQWRDVTYALGAGIRMIHKVVTLDGWWWQTDGDGRWYPPLPPVSCLAADPLPFCHNAAWFFDIVHTPLFMIPPVTLSPDDNREIEQARQASMRLPSTHLAIIVIGLIYRVRVAFTVILPWISGFALLCFMGAGVMQFSRERRNYVWVGAAVCATVIMSRIGLLALLDALMLYSDTVGYLAPVYPFVLLFCVLAPASLWRSVGIRRGAM